MGLSAVRRVVLLATLVACGTARAAAPPPYERIDAAIDAQPASPAAAPADDAEFLRRVYLDLVSTIASADEARSFLVDRSPDKRAKLIDRLLADERFPKRIAQALSVMLMGQRVAPDKPDSDRCEAYLAAAIAGDKPFDRIVAEILNPNADDPVARDAGVFWTKRLEDYGQNPVDLPGLTRDVGRMFLGVDLKCARCHNHLTVREYKQSDFQGLVAFVGHTYVRKDTPVPTVGEKLIDKKVEFASVFGDGAKRETGPRLPGCEEVAVPKFEKCQEYLTPPDKKKNFAGVPKFRALKVLAEQLPRPENERFRRNAANRLWFILMGRGLVHPLDLHHKDNPPSVPALLDALAAGLVELKFDVRSFVREVALSRAYRRSSRLPDGVAEASPGSFRIAVLKRMSAEQLLAASLTATGELNAVVKRSAGQKPAAPPPADDEVEADGEPTKRPKPSAGPPTMAELRKRLVAAFAVPAGEPEVEFGPTVAAALFVSNDPTVVGWLEPRDGNLVDRLAKVDDVGRLAEELYLSALTRMPTSDERAEVAEHVKTRGGDATARAAAVAELAWALLASTEFALNH